MQKIYLIGIMLCLKLIPSQSTAQSLVVTPGGAALLIVSSLVDPVLNPSNPVVTCGAANFGRFTASGVSLTKLGLNSGIVLSTGKVADAVKNPSTEASTPVFAIACTGGSSATDADITAICGSTSLYDKCMVEFDIAPVADALSIDYVFGSEEYYTYCAPGGSFNDSFGFFVRELPGGAYTNFALVPGSNDPVSVKNIYPTNCATPPKNANYFVDNSTGTTNVVYNGLTTPLNGSVPIQRGKNYHVKIAISDVGDACLDAGLFIKTLSFVLPKEILKFNAVKTKGNTQVSWTLANSINSKMYELLKSSDGKNFEPVKEGFTKSKAEEAITEFSFQEPLPKQGTVYYRLRLKDDKGDWVYSTLKSLIQVNQDLIKDWAIFPNPVGDKTTISINSNRVQDAVLKVYDLSGREILSKAVQVVDGFNEFELDTQSLLQGHYLMQIQGEDIQTDIKRFVK